MGRLGLTKPMTQAELDAKFLECAGVVFDKKRASKALAAVREITEAGNVRGVLEVLRSERREWAHGPGLEVLTEPADCGRRG